MLVKWRGTQALRVKKEMGEKKAAIGRNDGLRSEPWGKDASTKETHFPCLCNISSLEGT